MNEETRRKYIDLVLSSRNPRVRGYNEGGNLWARVLLGRYEEKERHVLVFPTGSAYDEVEVPTYYVGGSAWGNEVAEGDSAVPEFDRALPHPILPNYPELLL